MARALVGRTVVAVVQQLPGAGPGQGPITVATFDPARTRLVLHAGSLEPGRKGPWERGPVISRPERETVLAAFNGGFRTADSHGGWWSDGHAVVPLVRGAASVIISRAGRVDVRSWSGPADLAGAEAVRQNLQLLVSGGRPELGSAAALAPASTYWGRAFRGAPLVSRSALGVTADGTVVWAAGTDITVTALADALVRHHVVRALELDINAPLVRGFLFRAPASLQTSLPIAAGELALVAGQTQVHGLRALAENLVSVAPHCDYITSCTRDFFTVVLA